jgi:hypothetical protein
VSLDVILGNADAVGVNLPEHDLGLCNTLLGGLAIPLDRFCVVLGYALAFVVQDAEAELGICITLLGKRSPLL